MKKMLPIILLISVVLVSGCVDLGGIFKGQFGQGNVTELSPDIVVIQNENTYPTPPIQAGGEFTYTFEVYNQNNVRFVDKHNVTLIDAGLCKRTSGSDTVDGKLVPQQTNYTEWQFEAPSNPQIGNIPAKCPVKYKVVYVYSAVTQTDLGVISGTRLTQLQKAGEAPSFSQTQVIGDGPIKVTFEYGAPMPARTDSVLPVFITVEDKGSGSVEGAQGDIPEGKITVKIPVDLSINDITSGEACGGYFKVSGHDLINNKIPMIKKKSPQIRCSFTVPGEDKVPDEKTYYISSELGYIYRLDKSFDVQIQPTLTQ